MKAEDKLDLLAASLIAFAVVGISVTIIGFAIVLLRRKN